MKLNLNLDADSGALIRWLAEATQLKAEDLISRLLGGHLHELWELRTFLETLVPGSAEHDDALNLLQSYGGGESIADGIRRIKPEYKTLESQFQCGLSGKYENT